MTEYTPRIVRTKPGKEFIKTVARLIWNQLEDLHEPLITLPTGSTPLDLYQYFIDEYGDRAEIWRQIRLVALDEYIGLPADDRRLFQNWLGREILDPVGVPPQKRVTFNSMAEDADAEAQAMEQWIRDNGPIGLAILGLGLNGHIAFNEPGSSFDSVTRVIELSPETRETNAAYWGGIDKVPEQAFTLGLKTLAQAKQIFLLVTGSHKAEILDKTLNGPITPEVPASFLRTIANVTIMADTAALEG